MSVQLLLLLSLLFLAEKYLLRQAALSLRLLTNLELPLLEFEFLFLVSVQLLLLLSYLLKYHLILTNLELLLEFGFQFLVSVQLLLFLSLLKYHLTLANLELAPEKLEVQLFELVVQILFLLVFLLLK